MDSIRKVVLVPWDFTQSSEYALQHAIELAKAGDNEIMLLHIIPHSPLFDTGCAEQVWNYPANLGNGGKSP